jgi:hypothetical protein
MTAYNSAIFAKPKKRARRNRTRFSFSRSGLDQVEYLNSGIAFSSSLVVLNIA